MKTTQRVLLTLIMLVTILMQGTTFTFAEEQQEEIIVVTPSTQETQLESGLSTVLFEGDYGFDAFLAQNGASSDAQVVEFLVRQLLGGDGEGMAFGAGEIGCSVISVANAQGEALFGRNFDWQGCEALVVKSIPENGYASISTVNMSFLGSFSGMLGMLPPQVSTITAIYAPLDGMNEKGLCVAVNMIQDSAVINQDTDKPDITTTTTIRLLLDKAANVDEALAMLAEYDMHSSMGMMVHLALSDSDGRSVVVEYIDDEMTVIETPVVTNFYLAEGEKQGIGTTQSHTRYDMLVQQLADTPVMEMADVKAALDGVSKHNFNEFESTEWSIVANKDSGEIWYFHREDYMKRYVFTLEMSN